MSHLEKKIHVPYENLFEQFQNQKEIIFTSIFKINKLNIDPNNLNSREDYNYIQKFVNEEISINILKNRKIDSLFNVLKNDLTEKQGLDLVNWIIDDNIDCMELRSFLFSERFNVEINNFINENFFKSSFKEKLYDKIFTIHFEFQNLKPSINSNKELFNILGSVSATRIQNHIADDGILDWNSSQLYLEGQKIWNSGVYYLCLNEHNSGDFNTDLSDGKWEKLSGLLNDKISYDLAKDFVDILFNQNVGKKIISKIFQTEFANKILQLLEDPRINPPSLEYAEHGLRIKQYSVYEEDKLFSDVKKFEDFSADSCGNLFTIKKDLNELTIVKFSADNTHGIQYFQKEIMGIENYALNIEVNDQFIYVLEKRNNNSKIRIISRYKGNEIAILEKNHIDNEIPKDITINKNGNLLILSKSGYVYELIHDGCVRVSRVKQIDYSMSNENCTKFLDYANPIQNVKKIVSGKTNGKIYALHNDSKTVSVFDEGIKKLHQFKFKNKIYHFEVSDSFSLVTARIHNGEIVVEHYVSVIDNPLKINEKSFDFKEDFVPTRLFCQSMTGDLYFFIHENGRSSIQKYNFKQKFYNSGEILFGPFDSCILDMGWHKIEVDVSNMQNRKFMNFDIEHVAQNELRESDLEQLWTPLLSDPVNALLECEGRFLWLKLRLKSTSGENSPVFKNITIHFPKNTYLQYLPKIYQENKNSRIFLERFLSLFETMFAKFDEKIFDFYKTLDPNSTSKEFLPWLSSWIGLEAKNGLSEEKLRNLLTNAAKLYRMRGTVNGLKHFLGFCIDDNYKMKTHGFQSEYLTCTDYPPILILENFKMNSCISKKNIENFKEHQSLYGDDVYSFTILLAPYLTDNKKLEIIKSITKKEKPSHTIAKVCRLSPQFIVGGHTYLGINTGLRSGSVVVERTPIGYSTLAEVN